MGKKLSNEMNEETLKDCVIIPFLNSIGYNSEQLLFEKNFTLKLGKNTVKKKDFISGRLDILVLLNGEPFLIWELKRKNLEITSEEINQAISYSRLTDMITPFTIVSNGTETHIYNTITKQEIGKDELNPDTISYTFDEAIKLKIEALTAVICYSSNNFKKFINIINDRELNRLKGNKYIKELYVKRKEVQKKFDEFIHNDKKVFFITGNSGVGKTNILCNFVESNMHDNMILFYNSCFIETSIINKLMDDFNYGFDEQLYGRQLFNRINLLALKEHTNFIICIDAIDELAIQNPAISIDELLNVLNGFSNIKICLSCKESFINDYEKVNGISSTLKNISRDNIKINDFTDEEKNEIIDKYKKYFCVEIKDDQYTKLKTLSSDGFLFRIIFETYKGKKIDDNISNMSVMQKYIEKNSTNYGLNKNDLVKSLEIIGDVFISSKDNYMHSIIAEQVVDNSLRMNNSKISIDTLIKCNILQLYKNNDANYIDFNFKPLSYYVITILSAKLNTLNKIGFINKLFELNKNRRCKEALSWYSKNIKSNRYSEINEFKMQYGKKLITDYRKIVNKNFPNIKDRFVQNTNINNVGIAIDNSYDCAIYTYGFYKKTNNDEDVKLVDFNDKQLFMKLNMHSINTSMGEIDINNIIKKRLKNIIDNRQLNEQNCKNLNIENIIISTFKYGKLLNLDYKYEKKNFIPNLNEFIPLNLKELRKKLLLFNINILQKSGKISKEENPSELYRKQVDEGLYIPECNYIYNGMSKLPIYSLANRITSYILTYSEDTITSLHLLLPKVIRDRKNSRWITDIIIESFSKDELHNYLQDLLTKYIDEYILLVEYNFPTLKNKMEYYNLFKNGVLLILYIYKIENSNYGNYQSVLWYCYNENGKKEIKVEFCEQKSVPKDINKRMMLKSTGDIDKCFFNDMPSNSDYKYFVLSNLIYKLIMSDLKEIFSDDEKFILND